jgi:hypothetical protein
MRAQDGHFSASDGASILPEVNNQPTSTNIQDFEQYSLISIFFILSKYYVFYPLGF